MEKGMTATIIANACDMSTEWVRYHADRGRIPHVRARMGKREVRIFDNKGLKAAQRLVKEKGWKT